MEVVPWELTESKTAFVVETPQRKITALGTKFAVKAHRADTDVLVTQGKVKVTGVEEPLTAGQLLKKAERLPAPRASEALLWTKELMAAAESPLIPKSEHAGGALVAVDPAGQEMQLSLRKQHIDVHIEDGFARTTIDQTYFNASWSQMEGTFYFPLPADASLSRLAMYVGENLMEGGMAERDHARNVFEQIRYTRRDPALLEWVDGSTFKMRVFPLEARQEKRIVLSYTQRLPVAYGKVHYRFPAGHSLELIRDWSTQIRVKNHVGQTWKSSSHQLKSQAEGEDLILEASATGVIDDRDLLLELEDPFAEDTRHRVRFSRMEQDGQQYLMLRYRPDLQGELKRRPRNWVFLFESAGNRDSLLARVQIDVLETLLKNAEHSDRFSIVTAATRSQTWKTEPVPCTAENIEAAVKHLNEVHLVGALDLEKALAACGPFLKSKTTTADTETCLVHLGAGIPVLGEKETEPLLQQIPAKTKYVGVGVGKRWSNTFMKAAANRTGGCITQINPDEPVGWRAFELLSLLNTPRLEQVKVKDEGDKHRFLKFAETLAQGEELCALTRLGSKEDLPKKLTITGRLGGEDFEKTIPVENIAEGAGYLPRTWARLEIDRLVAEGAEHHKQEIIALSKAMYVMSPFTSLLVLENEQMYEQFHVDRGRKDHWALYPCPPKIPVVYEPGSRKIPLLISSNTRAKSAEDLLKTILVRTPPITYRWANGAHSVLQGIDAWQAYTGAIAMPMAYPAFWIDPVSYNQYFVGVQYPSEDFSGPASRRDVKSMGGSQRGRFAMGSYGNFSGPNVWFDVKNFVETPGRFVLEHGQDSGQAGVSFIRPALGNTVSVPFDSYSFNGRFYGRNDSLRGYIKGFNPKVFGGDLVEWDFDAYRRIQNGTFNGPMAEPTNLGRLGMPQLDFISAYQVNNFGDALLNPQLMLLKDAYQSEIDSYRERFHLNSAYQTLTWGKAGTQSWNLGFATPIQRHTPFFGRDRKGGARPLNVNFDWSMGRFGDLLAQAPGLNTLQSDILTLLESQGPAKLLPKRGEVDPQAKALIDRAGKPAGKPSRCPKPMANRH